MSTDQADESSSPVAAASPASPATAASPGGVDDAADKARLTLLYEEHDPKKMCKLDEILNKRPLKADRDKMWAQLKKKYPAFFQNESAGGAAGATGGGGVGPLSFSSKSTGFGSLTRCLTALLYSSHDPSSLVELCMHLQSNRLCIYSSSSVCNTGLLHQLQFLCWVVH